MEKYYANGTEPDVLPHFKGCTGPCNQGRLPCPCPAACETPEGEHGLEALGLVVMAVVVCVFAIIGVGAVVGYVWR